MEWKKDFLILKKAVCIELKMLRIYLNRFLGNVFNHIYRAV